MHESIWEHICEACYQRVGDCYDDDGDDFCDECYSQMPCLHEGMEGLHICRDCYDLLTECHDGDGDGMCDMCAIGPQ